MKTLIAVAVLAAGCKPTKVEDAGSAANRGTLEQRVKRLEDMLAQREEALAFLEKAYAQQKASAEAEEAREPAEDAVFAVDIRQNLAAGLVEGSTSAPVTIVKAFDFACPYCQQVNDTLEEVLKEQSGKVRVVYKNFVVHPDTAMPAHLASCAAAKQKKYIEFKNAFWAKGFAPYAESGGRDKAPLGHENILKIAAGIGLDTKKLDADMKSTECQALIAADMTELEKFQVGATPTLFINGTQISGALTKRGFEKIIEEKLAIVSQSGVAGADYYEKEVIGKGEKKFRSKKDPKP